MDERLLTAELEALAERHRLAMQGPGYRDSLAGLHLDDIDRMWWAQSSYRTRIRTAWRVLRGRTPTDDQSPRRYR